MSVVWLLRENDPATTAIRIAVGDETSDADHAQALEQNSFVTKIWVDLPWPRRAEAPDWSPLLRVIATRANLEEVTVQDSLWSFQRNAPVSALVRPILRAIQQNPAIRSVEMRNLRPITDISTFVDTASSITMFRLSGYFTITNTVFGLFDFAIPAAEREQEARSLAVAFQRNTNIETLELSSLEDIYAVPILEGLQSNVSVKAFRFSPGNISEATSHALQRLLESTTSIQRLDLGSMQCSMQFSDERLFHPIAQGIISSECVSELIFSSVSFQGQNSLAPLQSILLNKRNLTSLCLHECHFGGGQVHGGIISILSRPDSLLRCFEFHSRRPLEEAFPGAQYKNLLRAIEKSKLERFKIGSIQSQQHLQTFVQSIPSMKIEELEVLFTDIAEEGSEEGPELSRETIKQGLLQAVKNNFSLHSVKGEMELSFEDLDLFESAEDKQRLAFYANRNESLDQWADNPETVNQKVWPEALGLAQRAGPDALFRGLRSTLGSDNVSWKGRRSAKVQSAPPQPK